MSLYLNRADEALATQDSTQLKPRFDARKWFDELRKIGPNLPWYITYQPRMLFYPTLRPDRVLTASTVCEGEWRTFVLDVCCGEHVAVEVNHIEDHQPTILTAALMADRAEKSRTISDLRLDNEILRGQLAVLRQEQASTPRFSLSWSTIFALVFLGFSLFWHSANALTTTSTTQSINPIRILELNKWLDDFIEKAQRVIHTHHYTVVNTVKSSPSWILASAVIPYLWQIVAITLSVITVYKAEHRVISILFIAAASMSGADWLFLATASMQTMLSAIVQIACVVISHIDPIGAICVSSLAMFGTFLASMCATNTTFIQQSRAASINTATLVVAIVLRTLGLPSMPLALGLAIVRAYTILTTPTGATIEVRGEDGKVLSKDTVKPGLLFRFKQSLRKKFSQLRSTMPPLVRVNPTAVVRVETPDGIGTGFFCANYVVTAGHVVGQYKVVSLCVGSAKYQAPVVRHVDNKDIALLKIPPPLQNYPRLKIASKIDVDWVCVYSPDGEGAIISSVTPGNQVEECIDYATPTRDGMSGAPVVNVDGRVMAVHLTNTGFTGGAQILTQADVTDPPKSTPTEDKLRAELEELKKQLATFTQSSTQADIIGLIREAMAREMKILRAELNKELAGTSQPQDEYAQTKKGKTKRGRGRIKMRLTGATKRKQRGPVFTEQEYQELLDQGLSPDDIRDMVDQLYEEEVAGFPEWEEMSDGYDPDEDWEFESDSDFGQKKIVISSFKQYLDRSYNPKDVRNMLDSLTPADIEAIGPLVPLTIKCSNPGLCSALLCCIDRYAALNGLSPPTSGLTYTQRRVPKNGKRAQNQRAQKSTN
ncbi:MAG: ORF1a [Hainan mamastrovirus]|nr:MAG: ORF1a [Hainan mamastrovirus]